MIDTCLIPGEKYISPNQLFHNKLLGPVEKLWMNLFGYKSFLKDWDVKVFQKKKLINPSIKPKAKETLEIDLFPLGNIITVRV